MSKVPIRAGMTMAAVVAAGLCLTGCRTIHNRDFAGSGAAPGETASFSDSSVRPTPPIFDAEPVTAQYAQPSADTAKPVPYYLTAEGKAAAAKRHAPAASGKEARYTVKKGDILGRIAQQHGVKVSDILAVNPGLDANRIRVGQVIVLPASSRPSGAPKDETAGPGTYIVKKGDILGRIARQHGVKVSDLKAANGLTSDKILVGQRLTIPGKGAKPAEKAPPKDKTEPGKTTVAPPAPADGSAVAPPPPPLPSAIPADPMEPAAAPEPGATVEPLPPDAPAPADPAVAPPPPPVPAANPAPSAPNGGAHYTVKEGEDVYSLAIRWGVSPSEVKALNNLTGTKLAPGTVLRIPGAK
ncbi:MAG: LysM peptidoglycan-binding domain-containing protein [Kiritimatiellia bacterium]|jgi:LysM repeat protein